jgi:hypothetical protein
MVFNVLGKKLKLAVLTCLIVTGVGVYFMARYPENVSHLHQLEKLPSILSKPQNVPPPLLKEIESRDYHRYKCKDMKRIGGNSASIQQVPDKLYRIDGAWYVCFDPGVAIKPNDCHVLSFGIHWDDTFDLAVNSDPYKCRVDSFDPFVEPRRVSAIRKNNPSLKDSVCAHFFLSSNFIFYFDCSKKPKVYFL